MSAENMNKDADRQSQEFKSPQHAQVHGRYETIYDTNDFLAALCFVIGSALFFSEQTKTAGTWLFLIGSVLFLVRPFIHVVRDFRISKLPSPQKDGRHE